jgi:hypothetical protein
MADVTEDVHILAAVDFGGSETGGVCALATSGQAAAPPRSLMNSRRFIALINRPMTACAA